MEILNDAKRLAERQYPSMEELEAEIMETKIMFNAVDICANKFMWADIANVDFVFYPKFIKGTFVSPTTRDE